VANKKKGAKQEKPIEPTINGWRERGILTSTVKQEGGKKEYERHVPKTERKKGKRLGFIKPRGEPPTGGGAQR